MPAGIWLFAVGPPTVEPAVAVPGVSPRKRYVARSASCAGLSAPTLSSQAGGAPVPGVNAAAG